ncbi:MAG TPA: hypothetical protein VFO10_17915 [Oligoflexus sp.]|uniref:hypothetical protein n=1 Tax=Oligoflexus sp. TaxID=1971216 RepID=UPI002D7F6D56|nr:hypothetical protein [Oligoflexus sp.]HET9239141.1 hypothetical protein [Oligoflexus sp.]
MQKRSSMFFLMLLTVLLSAGRQAMACSSCGSGGADPVILNPYENHKLYLGLSHQSDFRDIDQHGTKRRSYGPQQKQSLDLAYAQRLTARAFVSAVTNFGRNAYQGQSEMQNGDASLHMRFNVVQPNIAEPWIPQLQLLVGHRFALGRSIYDQRRDHALDVFGAGYDETYLGADLWYGMSSIMFGGSLLFGRPDSATSEAGTVKPGPMQRAIATVGGMPIDAVKIIGGAIQEKREGFMLDGASQPDSDRLTHDLFLTMETLYPEGSNYRVTLNRRAAFGSNRNAVEATAITLAWMRAL